MVNLGFVTGFVRPYPGTRRDGQLWICHRLCTAVPRYEDAMVNFGFVTGFVRPYLGTRRDGQLRICHRLCTAVPRYETRWSNLDLSQALYGRTQVRDAMVNLGFVTGFVRPYLGTRRDGQLRICHRLCNIPHWFWRASQWRFVTWLVRPYPGTSVQAGIFLCDAPLKPIPVTYQPPPACTPVPGYGRTSQVTFCHLACTLASLMQLVRLKFQFDFRILTWWTSSDSGLWLMRLLLQPKATGRSTKSSG